MNKIQDNERKNFDPLTPVQFYDILTPGGDCVWFTNAMTAPLPFMGPFKVRNENETKRNETKTKRNETKRNGKK